MKLETAAKQRTSDKSLMNSLEFNIKRSQCLTEKFNGRLTYEEKIANDKMKEAQRRENDRLRDLKMERKAAAAQARLAKLTQAIQKAKKPKKS